MENLNIEFPIEIVQSCYEMQINSQNTTISILENYIIQQESSNDSKPKQVIQWIQKQFKHFGSIIRQWLSSLGKFFTKTIPEAIGKFTNFASKWLNMLGKKKKSVDVPEDATQEQKDHIKKTAEEVTQYNTEKMKDDVKPSSDKERKESLKNAKETIDSHIDAIENEKCKQQFKECMAKGYIPILLGEKVQWAVKCKRITKMVQQNLDCIADICNVRTDKLDDIKKELTSIISDKGTAEYFSKAVPVDPMNITTGTQEEINNSQELNAFIHTKFGQTWGYYVNTLHKAYPKSYLDSMERELVDIEEVKKDLAQFKSIEKAGKEIYNSANKQSDTILILCNSMVKSVSEDDVWKAQTFVGYIKAMQSSLMDYISSASKSYTGYANYVIKEYSSALDSVFNNK